MSFNCQNPTCTKKTQPSGVRPVFVVTKTREKVYTQKRVNPETGEIKEVYEGTGFETVKEIACCETCANRIGAAQKEVQVPDFAAMKVRKLAQAPFVEAFDDFEI